MVTTLTVVGPLGDAMATRRGRVDGRGTGGTVEGMTTSSRTGRVGRFTGKLLVSLAAMTVTLSALVPAVIWYVTAATPACGAHASATQELHARVGLVAAGCAAAALGVLLGVRYLRLQWGWVLWWLVPAVAAGGPLVAVMLMSRLSPGTGGLFCH